MGKAHPAIIYSSAKSILNWAFFLTCLALGSLGAGSALADRSQFY